MVVNRSVKSRGVMDVGEQVSSLLAGDAEVSLKSGYSSEVWTHLQGMAALDNGC